MQVSRGRAIASQYYQWLIELYSHIYCPECANILQLFSVRDGQRPICTACDGQLSNPEDVVGVNLSPSEDYKSCVLSGLSPTVILECAGRALSFWAYQTNSEMCVFLAYICLPLLISEAHIKSTAPRI